MKRTVMAIVAAALMLIATAGYGFGEEIAGKTGKKPVLIELKLLSVVGDRKIEIHPKICVLDGKDAEVKVQGNDTSLNDRKVDSRAPSGQGGQKPFLASIKVRPTVIEKTSPTRFRLAIQLKVDNNGVEVTRTATFTVIEGEATELETEDSRAGELTRLTVTASIYKGQFDKGKADVDVRTK